MAFGGGCAGAEEGLVDRVEREIMVVLNDDGVVGFGDDGVVPDGFDHDGGFLVGLCL